MVRHVLEGYLTQKERHLCFINPYETVTVLHVLNPQVDIPLFATNANPLQLYHSPRAKILAFKVLVTTIDALGHFLKRINTA